MPETETDNQAVQFLNSMRGRYIMAQALYYAIKELESIEGIHKEQSNIVDMKFLRDELFNFPKEVFENDQPPNI
mgnify:CR=1 FL=1